MHGPLFRQPCRGRDIYHKFYLEENLFPYEQLNIYHVDVDRLDHLRNGNSTFEVIKQGLLKIRSHFYPIGPLVLALYVSMYVCMKLHRKIQ